MKYSFFSSACAWFPSALMMAVSASGASSAPLASLVKYVPVHTVPHRSHRHIRYNSGHVEAFCTLQVGGWGGEREGREAVPLCLARYRPRTMMKHRVMKTTTATTPPMRAWSGPCCVRALGSGGGGGGGEDGVKRRQWNNRYNQPIMGRRVNIRRIDSLLPTIH